MDKYILFFYNMKMFFAKNAIYLIPLFDFCNSQYKIDYWKCVNDILQKKIRRVTKSVLSIVQRRVVSFCYQL